MALAGWLTETIHVDRRVAPSPARDTVCSGPRPSPYPASGLLNAVDDDSGQMRQHIDQIPMTASAVRNIMDGRRDQSRSTKVERIQISESVARWPSPSSRVAITAARAYLSPPGRSALGLRRRHAAEHRKAHSPTCPCPGLPREPGARPLRPSRSYRPQLSNSRPRRHRLPRETPRLRGRPQEDRRPRRRPPNGFSTFVDDDTN